MARDFGAEALKAYPGFKRAYPDGVTVLDAPRARINAAPQWTKTRISEFYQRGERGGEDMLPNPTDGSRPAIEIYHPDYQSTGKDGYKQELIVGEMLHGLKGDPGWAKLRNQFASQFTPSETASQHRNMKNPNSDFYSEIPGETHAQMMERSGIDAYIRGGFMPKTDSEWLQYYSPEQHQTMKQMKEYLKRDPGQETPTSPQSLMRFYPTAGVPLMQGNSDPVQSMVQNLLYSPSFLGKDFAQERVDAAKDRYDARLSQILMPASGGQSDA